MQFYIKKFSPVRDRILEKNISAPSAQKALVLLSSSAPDSTAAPYTRQPKLQVRFPSRQFFKNFARSQKIECLVKKNAILHKFLPVRDRVLEKKLLCASAQKALVLLSHKRFSLRLRRKRLLCCYRIKDFLRAFGAKGSCVAIA